MVNISCNKLIDVNLPKDSLTSDIVFKDKDAALSALNGLYIQYMSAGLSFTNCLVPITAGLMSDELILGSTNLTANEFFYNTVSIENANLSSLWTQPYARIYQCNALVEGANKSMQLDKGIRDRLKGEALFNRAFLYMNFIQLFGDVPLILSTDYKNTMSEPRTAKEKVYEQIENDLSTAYDLLTADQSLDKTRITKFTVLALQARVALYLQKWNKAEEFSSKVINEGGYMLSKDLANAFGAQSSEAIWQISPTDGIAYVWDGFYFIPKTTAAPSYPISNSLFESFSANDKRLQTWIGKKIVKDKTYGYAQKYRIGSGAGKATEYQMMLRFAEQYLIRAEALSNMSRQQEALQDLDKLRDRAGLPLLSGRTDLNAEQVKQLIAEERRHELFCEWGHRWFDLKRTNRVEQELKQTKPNFQAYSSLLPIPSAQLRTNPHLEQNPGYSN